MPMAGKVDDLRKVNETREALARLAAEQATQAAIDAAKRRASVRNTQWYLAHAGGTEKQTLGEFDRWEIEYYYPRTWGQQRVPKRELTASARKSALVVTRPIKIGLWKGYFFVKIDLANGIWRDAFERAHVHGIVANSDGGRLLPAVIRSDVIERIRAQEVDGLIPPDAKLAELLFTAGETVTLKNGPFYEGSIQEDVAKPIGGLDESMKVKVLVSLLGRGVAVEMPIGDIEKS